MAASHLLSLAARSLSFFCIDCRGAFREELLAMNGLPPLIAALDAGGFLAARVAYALSGFLGSPEGDVDAAFVNAGGLPSVVRAIALPSQFPSLHGFRRLRSSS